MKTKGRRTSSPSLKKLAGMVLPPAEPIITAPVRATVQNDVVSTVTVSHATNAAVAVDYSEQTSEVHEGVTQWVQHPTSCTEAQLLNEWLRLHCPVGTVSGETRDGVTHRVNTNQPHQRKAVAVGDSVPSIDGTYVLSKNQYEKRKRNSMSSRIKLHGSPRSTITELVVPAAEEYCFDRHAEQAEVQKDIRFCFTKSIERLCKQAVEDHAGYNFHDRVQARKLERTTETGVHQGTTPDVQHKQVAANEQLGVPFDIAEEVIATPAKADNVVDLTNYRKNAKVRARIEYRKALAERAATIEYKRNRAEYFSREAAITSGHIVEPVVIRGAEVYFGDNNAAFNSQCYRASAFSKLWAKGHGRFSPDLDQTFIHAFSSKHDLVSTADAKWDGAVKFSHQQAEANRKLVSDRVFNEIIERSAAAAKSEIKVMTDQRIAHFKGVPYVPTDTGLMLPADVVITPDVSGKRAKLMPVNGGWM